MTNRLQKIEKVINSMSDDKFNELLNELGVKEEKQWVPNDDEPYYWTVESIRAIVYCTWTNDIYDNYRLLMNNVFKTKEEALAQRNFNLERAKLIKEIEDSSDVLDWGDREQVKHYMLYIHDDGVIGTDENMVVENQGVIYTTNYTFLRNLIENEPERIKKYLFGIEE